LTINIITVDIGSTFTKGLLIDLQERTISKREIVATNIREGIQDSFSTVLKLLKVKRNGEYLETPHILVCSSAAGGLSIVVVGLSPSLSLKAGEQISHNAGAKVVGSFSYKLSDDEIEEINNLEADIILLAGGINGGDEDVISHNALKLSKTTSDPVVVIAGNKCVCDKIANIFKSAGKPFEVTENVLPEIDKLNIGPARDTIRKIFYERIIFAKGLESVAKIASNKIIPTPSAVLSAVKLLSEGTNRMPGIGPLLLIDIGGATTDVHSIGQAKKTVAGVCSRGLPEPYLKRTVEGDLGLRISAKSLLERGQEALTNCQLEELNEYVKFVGNKTEYVAEHLKHKNIDIELAKLAIKLSFPRHCGSIKPFYAPRGEILLQEGKDLSDVSTVIGTGGIFCGNDNNKSLILRDAFSEINDMSLLRPRAPNYLVDSDYIFWAMGLLMHADSKLAYDLLTSSIRCDEIAK